MKECGIYRIVNRVSDTTYIGSSVDVRKRLHDHRSDLKGGRHRNSHLQRAWSRYGERAFVFESLCPTTRHTRRLREQRFIDAYILNGLKLYNQKPSSESRTDFSFTHTPESRLKISRSKIGVKYGPQSAEHIRNKAAAIRGLKRTPEQRRWISQRTREAMQRPDVRAKMRKTLEERPC